MISDVICQATIIGLTDFRRPVTLCKDILWVSMMDSIQVFKCEEGFPNVGSSLIRPTTEPSFVAATVIESVHLAVDCRHHFLRIFRYEAGQRAAVRHLQKDHELQSPVTAAAWIASKLVFSTASTITIGAVDPETGAFSQLKSLSLSFSPNFALSLPDERLLFGKTGDQMEIIGSDLTKSDVVPLPNPHVVAVREKPGQPAVLMSAFGMQYVAVCQLPASGRHGCHRVPVVMPLALTETRPFLPLLPNISRHRPNVVLQVVPMRSEEEDGFDLAIVLHNQRLHFVRLPAVKTLFKHDWPEAREGELRAATSATNGVSLVVIATTNRCFRYDLSKKRCDALHGIPNAPHSFDSLLLRGEEVFCTSGNAGGGESRANNYELFHFKNNNWSKITGNNDIRGNQIVLMKDKDNKDLLLFLPVKDEHVSGCGIFPLDDEKLITGFFDISRPLVFDVSERGTRIAILSGPKVIVHEMKEGQAVEVAKLEFKTDSSIRAIGFLPGYEHLLSIIFDASAFCDLKVWVWDILSKDVFEIDVRHAITSYNFFDQHQLNIRLFWSLTTEKAFLLTDCSLVEINLKSHTTQLLLDSEWLLGSQRNRIDVERSFVYDSNVYLVLDNSELYWLWAK